MKNLLKMSVGLAAAAAMVTVAVTPVAVKAWDDALKNGRPSYTLKQVQDGVLGNNIVFNSISDSVIGDEKNFVGAREADAQKNTVTLPNGKLGERHTWNGNSIDVKENKEYVVRMYVHNNNPNGLKAVAEDVTSVFNINSAFAKDVKVGGYIKTKNATPSWYYDDVEFKSDRPFRLAYVAGSALLENNKGAFNLSDDVVKENGVKIGDNRDGKMPGCYEYAQYVSIKVRPVFEDTKVSVHKYVRPTGSKEWKDYAVAKVGDKMQYAVKFENLEGNRLNNVMVKDILPKNVKVIAGSAKLYNANFKDGLKIDENKLVGEGVNIGDYNAKSNAIVTFEVEVIDADLKCGLNRVRNWGQIGIGQSTFQDYADLMVTKTCGNTPKTLPSTGPAGTVFGLIGVGALITATGYYLASRKKLQ